MYEPGHLALGLHRIKGHSTHLAINYMNVAYIKHTRSFV